MQFIFMKGNLTDGYVPYGPYPDVDACADSHVGHDGWMMGLLPPTIPRRAKVKPYTARLYGTEKIDGMKGGLDMATRRLSDDQALDRIQGLMNGTEWNADTLDGIAKIVLDTGRDIQEPGEFLTVRK